MTELFETEDVHDRRLVRGATGLLAAFNVGGLLEAADVHVARRVCEIVAETDESVALAVALAVRAVRHGSVCVDLTELAASLPGLPWPDVDGWVDRVAASTVVSASVVRTEHGLLYLDRYWREEGQVRDDLLVRADRPAPAVDPVVLDAGGARIFPESGYDEQRTAARAAAGQWTTVLTGGPGTGKTTTVAGLLALLAEQSPRPLRIALTAPTGKAAARLQEAVAAATAELADEDRDRLGPLTAQTLHRLLGWRPDSRTRFRHHRGNRLPHDVVVVDETSMVSLTMMARLVEAVRADARLVLVGDPDQLASVEAGAVLADLVGGLADRVPGAVAALRTSHRFGARIGALAEALRDGEADRVLELLREGGPEIDFVDPDDTSATEAVRRTVLDHALAVRSAALAGDADAAVAALDRHRLLCAHREGPHGVQHWNRLVERWLGEATGSPVGWGQEWYVGRPLLVTANDYGLGLFNGDTGVVVQQDDGSVRAVIAGVGSHHTFATSRLSEVETMHAMTVHKSQGSQADEVTVLLPPEDSPLLTRELFYTAVTRAQSRVRVVGTEAAVRAAVGTRAQRATGLRQRLIG
ncbi:MAG TPA: exodeoxyribonuclease V subunit alpha [Nocardioides sp.]|nr:exodeoxyribonuclease V subunit alpha [Nocardioides sp.]